VQKISPPQREVNYNNVVDDIFKLEKKEAPAKKREYKRKPHNRAQDKSYSESNFF
jgi:hypothetical protein